MQNISKENIQILKGLEELSLAKLNNDKEIVDLNLLYGMFITEKNKFIFCKEDKFEGDDTFRLVEYFTNECVGTNAIKFDKIVYPWRKTGRQFSLHFKDTIFCLPIVDLLSECSTKEVFTKKDISYLYCIINEYLKENPDFIRQLFNNEIKKQR